MDDGVPAYEAMGSTYTHGALSGKSLLCATALGFKHDFSERRCADATMVTGSADVRRVAAQRLMMIDQQQSICKSILNCVACSSTSSIKKRLRENPCSRNKPKA